MAEPFTIYKPVSYTHLDVYKRQVNVLLHVGSLSHLILRADIVVDDALNCSILLQLFKQRHHSRLYLSLIHI